ncbi:aminoglycoside phosphotransferase family protein [Pseudonocardia sp. MH-G8]|uniref:aminoglycoside phosphotransferase family protein n=1 Tax=Pseudonocardia sp. MH-G8 TaxID=1854588 RepID=UPI001304506C|nr:aminoglycoside phosphotransferase family protein [Pseudonocardia sp. MH-G8]
MVSPFLDVDPSFRAQVLRRSPDSQAWLEDLPRLWTSLLRRWHLAPVGAARYGGTSVVLPVEESASGRRAAVKLVSPAASAADEAAALTAFHGQGAVRLFDVDVETPALLLEWLDGPSLSSAPNRSRAMRIAGEIAAQLATAAAPPGSPRLADQASTWLAQLRHQHDAAQRAGTAVPDAHFHLAAEIVSGLTEVSTGTPTHGDLSLLNIMRGDRGWVAVDPLLVTGSAAWEAHTVIRSHLPDIADADDPVELSSRWIREFTDAAGLDHREAGLLSFARFVASYYWESQNQGDTGTVEGLRRMATAIARAELG